MFPFVHRSIRADEVKEYIDTCETQLNQIIKVQRKFFKLPDDSKHHQSNRAKKTLTLQSSKK